MPNRARPRVLAMGSSLPRSHPDRRWIDAASAGQPPTNLTLNANCDSYRKTLKKRCGQVRISGHFVTNGLWSPCLRRAHAPLRRHDDGGHTRSPPRTRAASQHRNRFRERTSPLDPGCDRRRLVQRGLAVARVETPPPAAAARRIGQQVAAGCGHRTGQVDQRTRPDGPARCDQTLTTRFPNLRTCRIRDRTPSGCRTGYWRC
jgi:hypothetical protein